MRMADFLTYSLLIGAVLALVYIIWSYARNLKESPRDMWVLFLYKFLEYTAYGAINMVIILWLQKDLGMSEVMAGSYIAVWSMMLSVMAMVAGALVDTIGIKRTLFISVIFLLISRFFMAFVTNPAIAFVLGFIPMAIGFAIVGPLVSVAIKRYTTKEGAAMGFALFYVIMNIAFALGGWLTDWFRTTFALVEDGKIVDENFGVTLFNLAHFSTYQLMFMAGFLVTCVSLFVIFFIRDGVELDENGQLVEKPFVPKGSGIDTVKNAAKDTGSLIMRVIREKYFWIFIGMLTMTIPVRAIFFHFHYTFPPYGVRVLGEGALIGNIYGVLNPVLIVYMVPFVAYFTKKVSSYRMMIVGSLISSLACFVAVIPTEVFVSLNTSVLGELIFVKWLSLADSVEALAANPPVPDYWPLIFFILVFTVGEAIWSPRLMQFTAEIAPKGKEGTYIALSVLPWFAAKFVVGPMSGLLLKYYTPLDEAGKSMAPYGDHFMVWAWIGGMALLTPIGLLVFRNLFRQKYVVPEETEPKAE